MRILSIHLKNYRGVADRRIEFPRDGVTVLEGPNEAGKSSLAEALDLILDVFDSTTKKRWISVQPVGEDVGTEVEVELETGEYRFTYRKRFFKRRQTELTITRPRHEQLRGREAHERVQAILKETIDYDLWRALRVHQGVGVSQPEGLEKAPSLLKALDYSAGGDDGGESEPLFDAVQAHYARYYTQDRGQARKPLLSAYERVEAAAGEVKHHDGELERLEADVARLEALDRELGDLQAQAVRAQENAKRREREWQALSEEEASLSKLDLGRKTASLEESAARRRYRDRADQIAQLDDAGRRRKRLEAEALRDEPAFTDLEERLRTGRASRDEAEVRITDADGLVQLREKDANFRRGEIDLAQLARRRDRIQEAQADAEEARALLDETRVDDAVLKEVRELCFDLERAQAQLDAGGPRLKLKAIGAVELDGETLEPGTKIERTVAERATLRVPGALELEVTAGTSVEDLVFARDGARQRLGDLLAGAGVADLEAAEALNEKRKEAERTLGQTERSIEDDLGDLDFQRLCGKVENMRKYVERYPAERSAEPVIAGSFDAAVDAKRDARQALEIARIEAREAGAGFSATNEAWQEMRRKTYETKTRVRMAVEEERQAAAELQAASNEAADELIEQALRSAEQKRDAAEKAYAFARQEYESHEPDRLKELADNARRAAVSADARLTRAREERHVLAGRLEARGEDGLYERREEALTRLRHAELELKALERKAAAARLLFLTMRLAREEAQRSYVGPLRTRILELGRVVFGGTFDVELDEELRIATRTLHGRTLPFGSLSIGAQEQLSLLSRVAAALTVDPRDGAPLIFDDTLGYSDAARLEAMGAMLSKAGEQCQIIVLTSTLDRFGHVGGAHVIRL